MADKPEPAKIDHRQMFLSHAHADRNLARSLTDLVKQVYSGLVEVFSSTDPASSGGLNPGDEWYATIHSRLELAEAALVLATPVSITHPWLYWEAGIARAICPRGVTVIRVNLGPVEVPSPLSAFQSYDGLKVEDGGIGEMLRKMGDLLGMTIDSQLVDRASRTWVGQAESHEPIVASDASSPGLTPEHLDRIESLFTRMELAASRLEGVGGRRPGRPRGSRRPDDIHELLFDARVPALVEGPDEMEFVANSVLPTTSLTVMATDQDGDTPLVAESGDGRAQTTLYLRGPWLDHWTPGPSHSVRLVRLMQDIRAKRRPVDPDDLPFE